jgi:hypothetical protein
LKNEVSEKYGVVTYYNIESNADNPLKKRIMQANQISGQLGTGLDFS